MKAGENTYIEFTIDNIKTTMEYDLGIRYELQRPDENWEEVVVSIIRPGPIDLNSTCAENYHPDDDIRRVPLDGASRSTTVYPPVCLEAGQTYKVRLDFKRSQYNRDNPSASVLIDSVCNKEHTMLLVTYQLLWFYR